MNDGALIQAGGLTIESHPSRQVRITYKGVSMQWDEYREGGVPALHIICPRCHCFGLLTTGNKRWRVDDRGRLSINEPFRCDYCLSRFGVADGRMLDA